MGTFTEMEAERFRREADECRQHAELVRDPVDRGNWLKLAEDWEALANIADKRRRPFAGAA